MADGKKGGKFDLAGTGPFSRRDFFWAGMMNRLRQSQVSAQAVWKALEIRAD